VAFLCTTVLDYGDRLEGQVLHVGSRDECERVMKSIDAVSYSGDNPPRAAELIVSEADGSRAVVAGERWRLMKCGAE
jgi:hypothetical protein